MPNYDQLLVFTYDDKILVKNLNGKSIEFPRCGITNIEMFLFDMIENGKLDKLFNIN